MCITAGIACGRQVRERHTKLEEFAIWLASLMKVQAQEQQRQQQEEIAVALWDMYLAYGGKPGSDQQERFDEMKEDSAVFQKVHSPAALPENAVTAVAFCANTNLLHFLRMLSLQLHSCKHQLLHMSVPTAEDCLNLNMYA